MVRAVEVNTSVAVVVVDAHPYVFFQRGAEYWVCDGAMSLCELRAMKGILQRSGEWCCVYFSSDVRRLRGELLSRGGAVAGGKEGFFVIPL